MTCPQRCDCADPHDCLYTQHTPSYALAWIVGAALVAALAPVLVVALW